MTGHEHITPACREPARAAAARRRQHDQPADLSSPVEMIARRQRFQRDRSPQCLRYGAHAVAPIAVEGPSRAHGRENRTRPDRRAIVPDDEPRSDEPTSELQSLMRNSSAVFCLQTKITYNNKLPTYQ